MLTNNRQFHSGIIYILHIPQLNLLKPGSKSNGLKHKDSFGKSENLSKIFFAEILVLILIMIMKASHRAVMVCSESLLLKKNNLFELFFELFRRASEHIYTRYQLYFARCNYYQIVNLTSVQSVTVVQKYFG